MQTLAPVQAYQPDALYFVRSSDPNLFYTVGQVDGRCQCGQRIPGLMHCQCPDHVHRARDCKHVRAVLAGQVAPATAKATPKALVQHQSFPDTDLWGDAGESIRRSLAAVRQAVAS